MVKPGLQTAGTPMLLLPAPLNKPPTAPRPHFPVLSPGRMREQGRGECDGSGTRERDANRATRWNMMRIQAPEPNKTYIHNCRTLEGPTSPGVPPTFPRHRNGGSQEADQARHWKLEFIAVSNSVKEGSLLPRILRSNLAWDAPQTLILCPSRGSSHGASAP